MLSTRGVATGSSWSIAPAQPGPAGPSEPAVAPTSRCSAIAEPSGNGCATTVAGFTHASPSRSSASSRIAGDATVIGTKPAQWSWTKPGSVQCTELVAPPGCGACSSTVTSQPAAARWIAATSPLCPAPITSTRVTGTAYPSTGGGAPFYVVTT
jgi:hypothetical protein